MKNLNGLHYSYTSTQTVVQITLQCSYDCVTISDDDVFKPTDRKTQQQLSVVVQATITKTDHVQRPITSHNLVDYPFKYP